VHLQTELTMDLKGRPTPDISSIHVERDFRNPPVGFPVHAVRTFPYLHNCYHSPYTIGYNVVNVTVAVAKTLNMF